MNKEDPKLMRDWRGHCTVNPLFAMPLSFREKKDVLKSIEEYGVLTEIELPLLPPEVPAVPLDGTRKEVE